LFVLVLVLPLFYAAVITHTSVQAPTTQRAWTYLIYYASDWPDLEKFTFKDLGKLTEGQDYEGQITVHMLISTQTEGCYSVLIDQQASEGFVMTRTARQNMSDPKTIQSFVTESVQASPAENYVFHYAGHSSSWYTLSEPTSILPVTVLADALANTEVHFNLIVFDSCLMGLLESHFQLRALTDYIISCETYSPWEGFISTQLLTTLSSSNSTSNVNKYESIIDNFIQRNLNGPDISDASLTSTAGLDDLAQFVLSVNLTYADFEGHRLAFLDIEDGTFDLYEVVMALDRLTSAQRSQFQSLFNRVVIYYRQNEMRPAYNEHHHGLSVCRTPMMDFECWAYYLLDLQPVSAC